MSNSAMDTARVRASPPQSMVTIAIYPSMIVSITNTVLIAASHTAPQQPFMVTAMVIVSLMAMVKVTVTS